MWDSTGTDESPQVLTWKNWKNDPSPHHVPDWPVSLSYATWFTLKITASLLVLVLLMLVLLLVLANRP